ncbi:MATE family efflux transporter [Marinagarivorans algicola]|uniref:MATE family efflux transporter n=1 Tax=Marinagarivorans algicola TaxID=1513270 RepID=UPI0006B960A9|nr:MATE family efflux transporter [Marinagarivorans algicola]
MTTTTNPPPSIMQKSLFSLTWPIFIDTLMVFLINAADAWFLSQESDEAAAAVGAVLPIAGMCFSFFIALNAAGTAVAAQHLGKQYSAGQAGGNTVAHTFGALLILCAFAGVCISLLLLVFSAQFTALMGLTGSAATTASTYLHTLGFGTLILALRFGGSAMLQAHGKTQWNMVCTGLMTAVNIFFNYAFIYGAFGLPVLGVLGIALATCIAWGINLIATFTTLYFLRIQFTLPESLRTLNVNMRPILTIAIPSALEPLAWHISQLIIMSMIVSMGHVALATRVYAFNIIFIVIIFTSALSAGIQLKVAYLFGARQFITMHNTLKKGVWQGLLVVLFMTGSVYLFAAQLLGLFSQNTAVIALGTSILAVAVFTEVGRLLNMVVGFSVKVTGNAQFIATFGITAMWFIALPLTWLLGVHWGYGLLGIWLAMGVDECFRGGVATWYWYRKQHARVTHL